MKTASGCCAGRFFAYLGGTQQGESPESMETFADENLKLDYPLFGDDSQLDYCTREFARHIRTWVRLADRQGVMLAFTGTSGAVIAALVSRRLRAMKVPVGYIQVRKEGEKCHRLNVEVLPPVEFADVEFADNLVSYDNLLTVVVDDQVASGKTIKYLIEKVEEQGWKVEAIAVASSAKLKWEKFANSLMFTLFRWK